MNSCNAIKTVLFICSFFHFSASFGQHKGRISGKLVNLKHEIVADASVNILAFQTRELIVAVSPDSSGVFIIEELENDSVIVQIQTLEFGEHLLPVIDLTITPQVDLGEINIEPAELEEAVVVSVIPFARKEVDKTVITPDALLSNAGTSALDVLGKSPGVRVSVEGVISMYGRSGVLVYIDDKPTHLGGDDLTNMLRGIPAESIAQIELMPNPPARFDAEGNAGIVNIRMKRLKTKGLNGSVSSSLGHGINPRASNSFQFNYRYNKINIFSALSYSASTVYQDLALKRQYFDPQGNLLTDFGQQSLIQNFMQFASGRVGCDYFLNDKNTLGFNVNSNLQWHENRTDNTAFTTNSNGQTLNKVIAEIPAKIGVKSYGANANYLRRLKHQGQELLISSDVNHYESVMTQQLINTIYNSNDSLLNGNRLDSRLPSVIEIVTFKADYKHPLSERLFLESGGKGSFIQTSNDARFYDNLNGNLNVNNTFTNRFDYQERILAGYATITKSYTKTTIQVGLRFERTDIEGYQYGNALQADSSFSRSYNSLFPTVFVQHLLDSVGKHQLSATFGRRIDRPNYQDMNPFVYPLDQFTLYSGNPFLSPTFSYNGEVAYTFDNRISIAATSSFTVDMLTETIEQNSNTFYSRPNNISNFTSFGAYLQIVLKQGKWFDFQCYTESNYQQFNSDLYGEKLLNKGAYWFISPVATFRLKYAITAELTGSYITQAYSGQFITIPVWSMNAAIAKRILKEKGTVKLSCSDVWYTNQPGGRVVALKDSNASWKSFLDTRVLNLSFSYRFSKGKALDARKISSSEEERNRIR